MRYLQKTGLIALALMVGCSSSRKQYHQDKNDLQKKKRILSQTGSYDYRFPQRLKPGTYKFQAGRAESRYFQVKRHNTSDL